MSDEIEDEIYRRIKEQSPNDSIVVLQGDRRWLLERLDELEESFTKHATPHIAALEQDLVTAKADVERLIIDITLDSRACPRDIECGLQTVGTNQRDRDCHDAKAQNCYHASLNQDQERP